MPRTKCPNCGVELPSATDAFCAFCHESLLPNPEVESNGNSNSVERRETKERQKSPGLFTRDDQDKLIVLATFDNATDAYLLRNNLLAEGINASVSNEMTSSFGATIMGPSSAFWVEVLIKESDAETGLAIKNRTLSSSPSEERSIPEWTCSCGETVDAGFAVCWSCESEFDG